MNILYYLHTFPKLSESFVINEIYELTRRGHEVAVFSAHRPDNDVVHEEYEALDLEVDYAGEPSLADVSTLASATVLNPDTLGLVPRRPTRPAHLLRGLSLGAQCSAFIDRLDVDVDLVHGHFASYDKLGAIYAAREHEIQFTVTTHAYDIFVDDWCCPVADRADHVITISEYNKRYLQDRLGIETPIDVVRAGIRPEKFEPSDETVDGRLLTVCRFTEKKGLRYAIDAVAEIVDDVPHLEYHIVGSGALEDEIRRRIARYGLDEHVTLLGTVSDERLVRELDEAQVFVLPCVIAANGDRDGIPVSLMEAMAMETVPISTRVSGIPELIEDGVNGWLIEPRDAKRLAEAIKTTLSSTKRDDQFGSRARSTVQKNFDVATIADNLCLTLDSIADATGR